MSQLAGRVAIVTGGSGGIGRAVCAALETAGVTVVSPTHAALDVRKEDALWEYTESVLNIHKRIDFLIACHSAPLGANEFILLNTDIWGAFNLCNAIGYRMTPGGRIVLFSSIRAHTPRSKQGAYATAKAGIEGLTRALSVELGPRGILTNCIAPGAVLTPRTEANIDAGIVSERELLARTPTGRLTTPEEVADLAVYLCGPHHINGQVITIDGGWSVYG